MTTKAWYLSKTVWLNVITFLVLAFTLPQFGAVVPSSWGAAIALTVALLNLILRLFFTTTTITTSSQA